MTVQEFMALCDRLTSDVAGECLVMHVDKRVSTHYQEAEFTISVKLCKDVRPDCVVE